MLSKESIREKLEYALGKLKKHVESSYSGDVLAKVTPDDIVHETFARAVSALDDFDYRGDQQLFAWLKQIAKNYVISTIRNSSSRTQQTIGELLVDSGVFTPSSLVRRKETIQAIKESLDALDSKNRQILRLRYEEGHSFVQIARNLGISDAAARGRHRNGLEKLRRTVFSTGLISSSKNLRTNPDD